MSMKIATAMRINVTAEHIARGVGSHAKCCPIALAIRDVSPDRVLVRTRRAEVGEDEYYLPAEATVFIQAFDNDEPVEPFEFLLVDRVL